MVYIHRPLIYSIYSIHILLYLKVYIWYAEYVWYNYRIPSIYIVLRHTYIHLHCVYVYRVHI